MGQKDAGRLVKKGSGDFGIELEGFDLNEIGGDNLAGFESQSDFETVSKSKGGHKRPQAPYVTDEPAEVLAAEDNKDFESRIKNRSKDEDARFWDATDSEFFIAICFQSREMKEAFLNRTGLIQHGDKYLDGVAVAQDMGIDLTGMIPRIYREKKDKSFISLADKGGDL